MATRVPAVDRATKILDYLGARASREHTGSEIAAALDIHKGTCFAILAALTDSGLIHRDEATKAYSLGPKLLALGRASAEQHEGFREARAETIALAEELKLGGFICVTVGAEMVILDRTTGIDLPDLQIRIGQRTPLVPPLGTIFYAWSPPEVVEDWLRRLGDVRSDAELDRYRRVIAAVRARGYSIGGEAEVERQLDEVVQRLAQVGDHTERLAVAAEMAELIRRSERIRANAAPPLEDHHPSLIIGPIFDGTGNVTMSITLFGEPGQFTDATIPRYADRLLRASRRVTAAIGGRFQEGTVPVDATAPGLPAQPRP